MTDEPDAAAAPLKAMMPPYAVLPGFIDAATVQALLDYTLAHEPAFQSTRVKAGIVNSKIRISRGTYDLGPFAAIMERRVLESLPQLFQQLRMTPLDATKIELELVAHGDGAFYRRHIDTRVDPDSQKQRVRVLSCVYYFHTEPKGFSGGALRLFGIANTPDLPHIDIEPTHNSLVAFPSWAPHEVMPISSPSGRFADSRFAINCWVRRDVHEAATGS